MSRSSAVGYYDGQALMQKSGGLSVLESIANEMRLKGDPSSIIVEESPRCSPHDYRVNLRWNLCSANDLAFSNWKSKCITLGAGKDWINISCSVHAGSVVLGWFRAKEQLENNGFLPMEEQWAEKVSEPAPPHGHTMRVGDSLFHVFNDSPDTRDLTPTAIIEKRVRQAMNFADYTADFRHGMKNKLLLLRLSILGC